MLYEKILRVGVQICIKRLASYLAMCVLYNRTRPNVNAVYERGRFLSILNLNQKKCFLIEHGRNSITGLLSLSSQCEFKQTVLFVTIFVNRALESKNSHKFQIPVSK